MTHRLRSWLVGCALLAVALGVIGGASAHRASPTWVITDLGTLGGRVAYSSEAVAINARGEVIGNSTNRARDRSLGFLWRGGHLIALGTLGGASSYVTAINDRGQIVGAAETKSGKTHAFLWANGHMRDLGAPSRTDNSEALGITNGGLVVGVASRTAPSIDSHPAFRGHVVLWQNGRIRDLGRPWNPSSNASTSVDAANERGVIVGTTGDDYLGPDGRVFTERAFLWDGNSLRTLPPRSTRTDAADINESGQVIGWNWTGAPDFRAATWERGQMLLLPLPPGWAGAFTSAINDKGEVVGRGWNEPRSAGVNDDHALLWRNGAVIDLGTLGGEQSEADAINNRSQIVGTAETTRTDSDGSPIWHAFVWQNGGMIDLGVGYPAAINDRGQIVGTSSSGSFEEGHALVWIPN